MFTIEGSTIRLPLQEEFTADDWDCEYRRDPSGARDLSRRMADMAREGVDALPVAAWRPYWHPDYEPLWILGANAARRYDFDLDYLSSQRIDASAQVDPGLRRV